MRKQKTKLKELKQNDQLKSLDLKSQKALKGGNGGRHEDHVGHKVTVAG